MLFDEYETYLVEGLNNFSNLENISIPVRSINLILSEISIGTGSIIIWH
jgi:hypothetical protein